MWCAQSKTSQFHTQHTMDTWFINMNDNRHFNAMHMNHYTLHVHLKCGAHSPKQISSIHNTLWTHDLLMNDNLHFNAKHMNHYTLHVRLKCGVHTQKISSLWLPAKYKDVKCILETKH